MSGATAQRHLQHGDLQHGDLQQGHLQQGHLHQGHLAAAAAGNLRRPGAFPI